MSFLKTNGKLCPVLALGIGAILLLAISSAGQTITTVAGGYVGDGGPATEAALALPEWTVMDQNGNLFISDLGNNRVRKVDPSGFITTYAGTGIAGFSGDGGPAVAARLDGATGLALDSAGNLYIASQGNLRIRRVDKATGIITTIAGNGTRGYSGDGGPALQASLNQPWALAFDARGNLYFSDISNAVIRKISTAGIITTVAGHGVATGSIDGEGGDVADDLGDNGPATAATLNLPRGVVLDRAGNLYIADTDNHRVRKVNRAGVISTVAGTGERGFSGDDGPAFDAKIGNPRGLAFDAAGNLLISNAGGGRIRKVDLVTGIITTVAGSSDGFNGDGNDALETRLALPTGLSLSSSGSLLVTDSGNARVRKIDASSQIVTTVAGGYLGDGNPATAASLVIPEAMAVDGTGNLYIAENLGHRVRRVDTSGTISTLAGTGINGYDGDEDPAASAMLNFPWGVAVNAAGEVFIADEGNAAIRKVDATGTITTWFQDWNFDIVGLAFDGADNLYFTDPSLCVVRKVNPQGQASAVVAGIEGSCGYDGDGVQATAARLNGPYGIAVDTLGNLYIADTINNRIRRVDAKKGIISTLAGNGTCEFSGDGGPATAAGLCAPYGVAVDSNGNVFIADANNGRVRKVGKGGIIETYAGNGLAGGFTGDGIPAISAGLYGPTAVAVDTRGNVYVVDEAPGRIYIITPGKTGGKKK
jgi:sugar lactone lactonase YvrE